MIRRSELVSIINKLEKSSDFGSITDLAKAVSRTAWAKAGSVNQKLIESAIREHGIVCQTVSQPLGLANPPSTANPESREIQVFNEGGRGRKQCPECNKYVGVIHKKCACGFNFENFVRPPKIRTPNPTPSEPKEIQTFTEGGRGKRQCPECKVYLGIRHAVCICGFNFKDYVRPDTPIEEKEIKVYEEPGRGRKHCPGCNKYVGLRNRQCVCGFNFEGYEKVEVVKVVKTYETTGVGKKQCPKCSVIVGVRTMTCICGHDFQVEGSARSGGSSTQKESSAKTYDPFAVEGQILAAISGVDMKRTSLVLVGGKLPKPKGFDDESLRNWIDDCQQEAGECGKLLAPEAFRVAIRKEAYVRGLHGEAIDAKEISRKVVDILGIAPYFLSNLKLVDPYYKEATNHLLREYYPEPQSEADHD